MGRISFNNTHFRRERVTISSMKNLARCLVEIVGNHILPTVLYAIVFFKTLQVMMPNPGDGLGKAFATLMYFIPGLLAWMLVWYTVRKIYKMVSESADLPADSSKLDSAERLKLGAEAEESAKGTPIKEGEENKPGSSAGVWMAWFWGLVAVGWLVFIIWLVNH
jgi:hypothetical protein